MEHSTWAARLLEILNGYICADRECTGTSADTIAEALSLPAVRRAMRASRHGSAQARSRRRMETLRRLADEAHQLDVGVAPRW